MQVISRPTLVRKRQMNTALNSLIPKSRTVRNLLIELASLWKRRQSGEEVDLPMVTLHLTSGKDLSGWLMDAGAMEAGATVFLRPNLSLAGAAQSLVVCAEFSRIEAISLKRSNNAPKPPVEKRKEEKRSKPKTQDSDFVPDEQTLPNLSVVSRMPPAEDISGAQIQRMLMALESHAATLLNHAVKIEVSWKTVATESSALSALGELILTVKMAINELLVNSYRREDCRRLFQMIRFQNGERTGVQFTNETLVITAPLNKGNSGYTSSEAFRHDLESLF